MAFQRVKDEQLAAKLAGVFRKLGYEGASLARISEATGLEKASLYHRFPGGKEEMVQAAIRQVGERFGQTVIAALASPGTPADRLRRAQRGLREFYEDGGMPCALDTLSLPAADPEVNRMLRESYAVWLAGFAALAREAGFSAAAAKRQAQKAIVVIEGALVIARVTGEAKPFRQAVAELPRLLLGLAPAQDGFRA